MSISFQCPKSWPLMNGLACNSSQTQKSAFLSHQKGRSEGLFLDKKNFPGETVSPIVYHTYSESYASKGLKWNILEQCQWILLGARILLANCPLDSTTSETVLYIIHTILYIMLCQGWNNVHNASSLWSGLRLTLGHLLSSVYQAWPGTWCWVLGTRYISHLGLGTISDVGMQSLVHSCERENI